ncbi:hypothetical protein DIPPA_02427 [Diplonema papillatum]|nr:hypothetical protein DIPPA_02427 [Diplonema papillatum]
MTEHWKELFQLAFGASAGANGGNAMKKSKRIEMSRETVELPAFKAIVDAVLPYMDEGHFDKWVHKYTAPGLTVVFVPKMSDPEHDGRAYGQENALLAYNAYVLVRFPDGSPWEFREEIWQLTPTTFQIDHFSKEPDDGERRDRLYYCMKDNLVNHILRCPQDPDELSEPYLREVAAMKEAIGDITIGKPPCWHNSWDSIRGRKSSTVLRCRECQIIWKLKSQQLQDWRCVDFYRGCVFPKGQCRKIHVHLRKIREEDDGNDKPTTEATIESDEEGDNEPAKRTAESDDKEVHAPAVESAAVGTGRGDDG